jgi:hypothetical protein
MPDWDEFSLFVEQFLLAENATLVDKDYGMDRHQVRFRLAEKQYVMQFEHYTDSIWVEQDC